LLAHAARKVLACAARLIDLTPEQIAERADTPLLVGTSVKAALDIEWSDPAQKASAIGTLVEQLDRLERWIVREFGEDAAEPPLAEPLATLRQLREQDLDPEPPDGKPRIRKGTAEDRRVSVEDKDMRHGRKRVVPSLQVDIARGGERSGIEQLSIDRGYINSPTHRPPSAHASTDRDRRTRA
jgi:hypothetical protein